MKRRISWVAVLAMVLAVLPLASVGADGPHPNLTPAEVEEVIFPGYSVEVEKIVHTPEIPPMVEVCLLEDETGSFGDDIGNLQGGTTAGDIYDAVVAASPGARFAVAGFRDYPVPPHGGSGDWVYRLLSGMSPLKADWLTGIATLSAGGGADGPEAQYDAIVAAVLGGFGADPCGFSDDPTAAKVLVVATDAPFHLPGAGKPHVNTEASTIAALDAADIVVVGLKAPGAGTELDALAAATGGSVQPLSSDGANIAAAILAGLSSVPVEVTMVSDCDYPITTTFEPASQTVISGEHAVFIETISVDAAAPGGTYECVDYAYIGGELLDTYTVTQGGMTYDVAPLASSQSITEYYAYELVSDIPAGPFNASSARTDIEVSETSLLFLYGGTDGLSLVALHDRPEGQLGETPATGGSVDMTFSNLPGTASWVVQDDPGEDPYAVSGGTSTVGWNWIGCCTDGGALNGGLAEWLASSGEDQCITVEGTFNSGIDEWWYLSGDSDSLGVMPLDMGMPVEICARPLAEHKMIRVPEGFLTGGGQIGRGSAGMNFGGNVGYLNEPPDYPTVGQWQFNDRGGLKMHSTSIEFVQFWNDELEGPEPPDANANAAYFGGTARVKIDNGPWDENCIFLAEAHDHGEPAKKGDSDAFGIAIDCGDLPADPSDLSSWDHFYEVEDLDAGNLQIHSGLKG